MKRRLVVGGFGVVMVAVVGISGCGGGDELWGTFEEATDKQELPKLTGGKQISRAWVKRLGAGAEEGYAILQPRVVGEVVYAANRDGRVYKIDATSGDTLWQGDVGGEVFSAADADARIVVVALENGEVVALSVETAEEVWRTAMGRQISAVPAVGEGRVVVRTAGGVVAGLNAADGKVAWSVERTVPGLAVHGDAQPAIVDDVVFIGLSNGKLLAMNVVTGAEYWEREISAAKGRNELERLSDADAQPLIAGNTIFGAAYQGSVAAVQVLNAEISWRAKVSTRLPMALADGKLLVTDELGAVVALDVAGGEVVWKQEAVQGRGISRPLALRGLGRVVVGDAAGNIYSLDLASGELLEVKKVVDGAVLSLVGLEAGRFVVLSSEGQLAAVGLGEG